MTPDALTKLQVLLKELFQIEAARDLDFGIYRIMNEKRGEVENFIDSRLPEVVDDALESGAAARSAETLRRLEEAADRVREILGEDAINDDGDLAGIYHGSKPGREYLDARENAEGVEEPGDLRASIFNHLFTFFSRYYDNGDFISRRRYSKRERYAIPYNGEEVHLHWANADQYYVKSGSFFLDYAFESGGVKVRFEVASAKTEHDNVKEGERSFVPLTEDASYDAEARTVTIPFEWRPLTAEEKKEFGGKRDGIPARSERDILSKFGGEMEVGKALSDPRPKKNGDSKEKPVSVLAHHLSRYARKNSSDFFVHKDLGGFLARELDFYIKNEVLDIEDLLDADGGNALAARMETVRAMRGISHSIIAFLAQIEAFQKRLFEKKKFVVSSHFCMTLDRVPEKFHEEISNNDAQYEEWKDLFATSEAPETLESVADPRSVEWLAANPHLVLDTKHFDRDFEDRLLSGIEDLDDATDGLLINSDNFQALNLIGDRYRERFNVVFIDPPYNTGLDGFIYKDRYQHSSWLTMMENRLDKCVPSLASDAIFLSAVDFVEVSRLRMLLDLIFGEQNFLADIAWEKRYTRSNNAKRFYSLKDSVLAYRNSEALERLRESRSEKSKSNYTNPDNDPRGLWISSSYVNPATKEARRNLVYPIKNPFTGEEKEHPTHAWKYDAKTHAKHVADNRLYWGLNGTYEFPRLKSFLSEASEGMVPIDVWHYKDTGTTDDGGREVKNLFGAAVFDNPKPTSLVRRVLQLDNLRGDGTIVVDFFAGSGTTGHAVIDLNREDGGNRKYILVEQGRYFDSVLKRRIMKVVYSKEWKDGKPTNRGSGVSHMFKYMTLESYEDALDNVSFGGNGAALDLYGDEYLLRYMLGFESRDSQTLLNVAKLDSPFDYKLTVRRSDRDDGESRPTCVDLPETFSYLLGMRVRSRKTFHDGEGRRYLAYRGETAETGDVAVIWRDTRGWSEADDYERDRDFVAERGMTDGAKEVFVNGDSLIPDARPVEPTFKKLMLPEGG